MSSPPLPQPAIDWAALPEGPLSVIATFLPSMCDYAAVRAVCCSWRRLPRNPLTVFPLLLLPYSDYPYGNPDTIIDPENTAHLLSLPDCRHLHLPLPDFAHLRLLTLAHGYLLAIGLSPSLSLINPFTSSAIPLPPLTAFLDDALSFSPSSVDQEYSFLIPDEIQTLSAQLIRDWFIKAAVISADPIGSSCVVMVVLYRSCNVSFCHPGDQLWTSVDTGCESDIGCAAFFRGKFYILDRLCSRVIMFDASDWPPKPTIVLSSPWVFDQGMLLVDAVEELLLIVHNKDRKPDADMAIDSWKNYFEVFRMQLTPAKLTWIPAREIGGKTLFLGQNYSVAVMASEFPCSRPNCMYFRNTFYKQAIGHPQLKDHNILVFSIKDGSCEKIWHYHSDSCDMNWRYDSWFLPKLA